MSTWLKPVTGHWSAQAAELLARGDSLVRVSVVAPRGSTPREAGATLLVTAHDLFGTIGGGQLEWQAVQAARALLADRGQSAVQLHPFTLGPDLNQCCGGRVGLWIERLEPVDLPALDAARRLFTQEAAVSLVTHFTAGRVSRQAAISEPGTARGVRCISRPDGGLTLVESGQAHLPPLWLFGAGHVGQAILKLFADLPAFAVTCIDSRRDLLPPLSAPHLKALHHASPAECVADAPAGTRFLVMTHDHALDYALCRAILARDDTEWLGLIGSASKGARFRSRLVRDGFSARTIARLCSPIGLAGIHSKLPAAIAVGVVAQLMTQLAAVAEPRVPLPIEAAAECTGDCGQCDSLRRSAP
jgi:xanthine dehydrogenase accessory factor